MEKDVKIISEKPTGESIIIPDECGDSMWDEVLNQEVKTYVINSSTKK